MRRATTSTLSAASSSVSSRRKTVLHEPCKKLSFKNVIASLHNARRYLRVPPSRMSTPARTRPPTINMRFRRTTMRGPFFSRPIPRWLCLLQLFLWPATAVFLAGEAGIRFNTTASVPIGLYRITSDPTGPFVELCPPGPLGPISVQRGYRRAAVLEGCPDGGELVLKVIVARPGDLVETSVNGMK